VHLAAIVALVVSTGFRVDPVTLVVGGLAYGFIALMAVTSNDRAVRALGVPLWHRLHLVGSWYLWVVFLFTYARTAAHGDVVAIIASIALLSAAGLRLSRSGRSAGAS